MTEPWSQVACTESVEMWMGFLRYAGGQTNRHSDHNTSPAYVNQSKYHGDSGITSVFIFHQILHCYDVDVRSKGTQHRGRDDSI